MKVFVPEQILGYSTTKDRHSQETVGLGIPISGSWKEAPNYFRQITSGNAINDVIQAKVVADTGANITCAAYTVDGLSYPASVFGSENGGWEAMWTHCAAYVPVKRVEYRLPDNYKGKKKLTPRRYEYYDRETLTALLDVGMRNAWNMCGLNVTIIAYAPLARITEYWPRWKGWYCCPDITMSIVWNRFTKQYELGLTHEWFFIDHFAQDLLELFKQIFPSSRTFGSFSVEEREANLAACTNLLQSRIYPILKRYGTWDASVYRASWIFHALPVAAVPVEDSRWTDEIFRPAFVLQEPEVIEEHLDPVVLGKGFRTYWRNYLTQHALLEAVESFPKLNDNSISNIMEIVGFVKALVYDHKIEIPKSLGSAWLSYRYQYTTTKLDVQEAVKFVRRHSNLGDLSKGLVCHGTSHVEVDGVPVTCRCEITVTPKELKTLDRILRALDTYGLTPDFYVIWDMIPYSFIVDWFLPISDVLGVWDANSKYFSGSFYSLDNLCYSLSYTRELDCGLRVKCYSRWKGSIPSSLNGAYWLEPPGASDKTVWYRIIDAGSLFIWH